MIIGKENSGPFGSFKLGYSRGLPSYMAPKLFMHKKAEEYFVCSLYAQMLFYNKFPIIGVEVCEDDSDKGADVIIKILNCESKKIQVTRFTLTEYLKRRKIAEKKVDKLIDEILKLINVEFPINIAIDMLSNSFSPLNNQKTVKLLSKLIADSILNKKAELLSSNNFINCQVVDKRLKMFTPQITLQSIPKDFNSNFFGRDNIFIDLDFDNISFSKEDIENECLNIYDKKNGGKAEVLLIWADTFEILYNPQYIIERLKFQFEHSTFKEVLFFNFYNRLDLYLYNQIHTAQIK
jgi:hypothetical protein